MVFASYADNFPGSVKDRASIYVKNLETKTVLAVSKEFDQFAVDHTGFSWPSFSADGKYIVFRSLKSVSDQHLSGGRFIMVWDVKRWTSALKAPGGSSTGWTDGCTSGTNNGTRFGLGMSAANEQRSNLLLFTIQKGDGCELVLRDLAGSDVPIRPVPATADIIEPAVDSGGTQIAWATKVQGLQQTYSCSVTVCAAGAH